MSGSTPHFATSLYRQVLRFPSQEPCVLQALDESAAITPKDEATIATICNEPLIYHRLFSKMLGSQPYSLAKAQGFVRWAQQGWRDRTWFVFLLRDATD